jgi:hypothetical protein
VNDGLAFLLEIAALVALAVWGFTVGANLAVRLLLGLSAPAVLIAIWSVWLAPGSDNRLDMPWLVIVKVVVFGLATVALAAAGHPRLATLLGVLAVVNLGVSVVLGSP